MKRIAFLCLIAVTITQLNCSKTSIDLNTYFKNEGVKGSITIYDLKRNKWIYSNKEDAIIGTLPASTFKIPNSLIALQEKVIKPGDVLKWDGKDKKFKGKVIQSWNMDTDIEQAFKKSTIWFYVELAKNIKKETYKKYLKIFNWGNLKLNEKGYDFWNYGDFTVTPVNQINFLIQLHNSSLPLSKVNMEYVKSTMVQDKNENYILRGKTGWGIKNNHEIGWYVGYIETGNNTYFFATRIICSSENLTKNFSKSRKNITLKALKVFGLR